MKKEKSKCPLCKGTGYIIQSQWQFRYSDKIRNTARELFSKGISLRKIGEEIGVNSPQKVKSLIMAKTR